MNGLSCKLQLETSPTQASNSRLDLTVEELGTVVGCFFTKLLLDL